MVRHAVPAWILTVSLGAAGLIAGCDHLAVPPANHTTGGAGAVAAHMLPSDLAGPPETLNLPRRSQPSPTILILRRREEIQIYSHDTRWRGRQVTVYYVPPENVEVRGGEHYLQSSAGLQRIGSASIDADGGWRVTWHIGSHDLPGPRTYLLARTDTGQIGLVSFET